MLDNRADNKYITQDKNKPIPCSLCNILKDFGLNEIFEIHMLGNVVYKDKGFYVNDNRVERFSDFQSDFEEFNFRWFKCHRDFSEKEGKENEQYVELENYDNLQEYHESFIKSCRQKDISIKTYSDLVYQKIKSSDFVLLDFFLDDADTYHTYLAFDFIKDICDIKKKKGDYSTTWYFITSAVYDSVVKYSQSGLLSEYYESAVVNAGDDPTNEKRQIIFVYKLLTFINARLRNFRNLENEINSKLFAKNGKCNDYDKEGEDSEKCGPNCLENKLLVVIRRYLNEFDDVKDIVFSNGDEKGIRLTIMESLENLIKQFIWLPEADWYMIQHQIDFVKSKLERLKDYNNDLKESKFSCNYVIEEIRDRSEVY